jgi:hypothetical protein
LGNGCGVTAAPISTVWSIVGCQVRPDEMVRTVFWLKLKKTRLRNEIEYAIIRERAEKVEL